MHALVILDGTRLSEVVRGMHVQHFKLTLHQRRQQHALVILSSACVEWRGVSGCARVITHVILAFCACALSATSFLFI